MKRIKESELNEHLKEFQNTNLQIEFENEISGKIVVENGTVNFNREDGYIYINYDKGTLKINTTLVTGYEVEKKLFSIQFETLIIKIKRF
jgi:outer membrane protein assembly factor BamB